MRRFSLVLSTLLLVLLGVSCSGLPATPISTPFPPDYIPTVIGLTVQAGQSGSSTSTPAPTPADFPPISPTPTPDEVPLIGQDSPTSLAFNPSPTSSPAPSATSTVDLSATPTRRPTRTPTVTPTPTIPVAGVQIDEPGPMSRVSSPVHLIANLRSFPSGTYHVEIWLEPLQPGGDARMLYREVQRIISNPIPWVYLDQDIQFELSRVSEFGQLRLSVFDQYGRPITVSSVDLLMLSMGVSEVTPGADHSEPIVVRQPTPHQLIQGGTVIVSGLARPSEDFMLVELVATDGSVVGYRQVFVTPAPDGSYVPYSVEVPYQVEVPTWVRLEISESSTRITGIEHLSSVEVYLSP